LRTTPHEATRTLFKGLPFAEIRTRTLLEDIRHASREHAFGGREDIERFPKQDDFAAFCDAVAEKALMNVLAGNAGLPMNRVLAEGLVWSVE
jgi:hypothetical protein